MTEGPGYKTAADGHRYHKSASANATIAPTNQHTIANATKTKHLDFEEADFVTTLDFEWNLRGKIDLEYLHDEYGFDKEDMQEFLRDSRITDALQERGIPLRVLEAYMATEDEAPKQRSKISGIQLVVANAVLNMVDNRPMKKKLQDAGVTPFQYQGWLKDENFTNYLRERSEGLFGEMEHEITLALLDKAASGDLKAIEYYNEMTGKYIRASQQGNGSAVEFHNIVTRIIEIIVDEVDDLDTATRINERLRGLVMGNAVANALTPTNEPIIQPTIAKARVIPKELDNGNSE